MTEQPKQLDGEVALRKITRAIERCNRILVGVSVRNGFDDIAAKSAIRFHAAAVKFETLTGHVPTAEELQKERQQD